MTDKEFKEFLDDRVDDWHEGRTIIPRLHDYLRMTWEEFSDWMVNGNLPVGMKARWGM